MIKITETMIEYSRDETPEAIKAALRDAGYEVTEMDYDPPLGFEFYKKQVKTTEPDGTYIWKPPIKGSFFY